MNKYQKTVASVLAASTLLLNGLMPVFASTSIVLSGNGSDSKNTAEVTITQSTSVVQSNNADVSNDVNAKATTGGNEASKNTGGDVSIKTGDASTDVTGSNLLNKNSADVKCCGSTSTDVLISGNGADSKNKVELELGSEKDPTTQIVQTNYAKVKNEVDAFSGTGKNEAEKNTGGSVSIETGDASTSVNLSTRANENSATVGGGEGGTLSAQILGNGTKSDNEIDLDLSGGVVFQQDNKADVKNEVDAFSGTGKNEAEKNTGGDSSIKTGDATTEVSIDNMVNFNWADANCGCLLGDLLAKIAGNGADTKNKIEAELGSDLAVFQGNCSDLLHGEGSKCRVKNEVDAAAKTGGNELESSTGTPGGDPSVQTGDASSTVDLSNSGNSNVYGHSADWEVPSIPGFDFNFNFSFNLGDLLDWLSSR